MKNFSTVGLPAGAWRQVVAAVAASLAMSAGHAGTCAFLPNAPDQHVVVKGDTLWGISGTFLEHPWCWPEVWGLNKEQIHNPHWIYPGQIVYFDRASGRLSLDKPQGAAGAAAPAAAQDGGEPPLTRLSPQLRTEGLGRDAVQSIPSAMIEAFLTQPLIVETDELKGAPHIAATQEGHVYLGKGDTAYVAGDLKGGTSFQVYRPGKPLRDPASGALMAYEAFYLGTVKLQQEMKGAATAHTFSVASSVQEMGAGDLLTPAPPTPLRNYVPHQPERLVDARVMSIYGGVEAAGQSQVVSINRGALDGLDVGAVLQLYHFGKTVVDEGASKGWFGMFKPKVKLPDTQYGTLFVFRVFKHVAYGLIMQVTEPVQVGDVAKSPE